MPGLGKLALVVASLALALVGSELAVRALGLAPAVGSIDTDSEESAYRRSDNPLLGFELKADFRDSTGRQPSTNAHGQRDRQRSLTKPVGVRRVILLGDSVVEGWGLPDLDDTLSRQLEALHPDGSLEVLNFGISGYSTRAEVELLEQKGLAFAPDGVVLLFTENDFHNLNRDLYRWREVHRPEWVRWAFPRSALFRVVALRLDLWGLASQLDPTSVMRGLEDNLVVDALARWVELADREGFAALLAIWPRFTDARITDANALPGERGEGPRELVIERLAAMHGLETLRLSPAFRRDWRARGPEGGSPAAFYTLGDGLHPNPDATALAARALDEALAGISQRPRPAPVRRPDDAEIAERSRSLGAGFEERALEQAGGLR